MTIQFIKLNLFLINNYFDVKNRILEFLFILYSLKLQSNEFYLMSLKHKIFFVHQVFLNYKVLNLTKIATFSLMINYKK